MPEMVSQNELHTLLHSRKKGSLLSLPGIALQDCDLSGWDLSYIDLSDSQLHHVCLDHANLSHSNLKCVLFDDCSLREADMSESNLQFAVLRYNKLCGACIKGSNLYGAILEEADVTGVVYDDKTQYFKMRCPEEGPFVAYKKCQDDRVVQLLIPADAMRSSSTLNTCRCSKAKVLSIKSVDKTQEFNEAYATITDSFVYKKGKWVEIDNFDTQRWHDAAPGIHFWMTWEEATRY